MKKYVDKRHGKAVAEMETTMRNAEYTAASKKRCAQAVEKARAKSQRLEKVAHEAKGRAKEMLWPSDDEATYESAFSRKGAKPSSRQEEICKG